MYDRKWRDGNHDENQTIPEFHQEERLQGIIFGGG